MKIDSINVKDLSGGIVQKIGDELSSPNIVHFAENFRFDKTIGRAILRDGTSLVGSQIEDGKDILGLHQFILSSGTKHLLSVCNNSGDTNAYISRYETDTWETKSDYALTASTKTRFVTYLDTVVALNGTEKFASEDGDTWVSDSLGTPTACTATLAGDGAGNVTDGEHIYKITYVTSEGETEGGTASNTVTVSDNSSDGKVDLTSIPTGGTGCTARKIYRTKAGGSVYYLLATISDNTTTTYEDNIADGSLPTTTVPETDTTGTPLDIGNFPIGKYAIEWNSRVYTAGVTDNEDRLYFSSTPTDYIISWTGAGSGYIDIEPYEGQGTITALAKVPGYLLIFKERALKRWNGQTTYPDDLSTLGTNSQESVVLGKRTVYYFSSGHAESVGFYETNGEESRKISRPIQGIIDAISSSYYDDVAGFSDGEKVIWSIGDITWDGVDYTNVVVMYHFDSQTWTLLTFPTQYKVFSQYIDGSTLKIVAGDDDGQVINIFDTSKTTDETTDTASADINYTLQYHPFDFQNRSLMKEISKIVPYTEDLNGAVFSYRIDKQRGSGFKTLGTVTNNYTDEFNGSIAGHVMEFKYSGTSSSGGEIIGFDIVNPDVSFSVRY
jgi:hypothetical protein